MKWTKEAIRKLRFDLGNLTQEQFAKRFSKKTSPGTISNWETGKTVPSSMAQAKMVELQNTLP